MEIWEKLKNESYSYIQELCAANLEERLDIEFKEKDQSSPNCNKTDKQNLGATLSAFSNSTGGILFFGIRTTKIDNIDCADEIVPIKNLKAVFAEIQKYCENYLSPPNPNIEVWMCEDAKDSDQGVIAISVAVSDWRPHMSKAPNHNRYYFRGASGNMPMEDYQVRDLHNIKQRPRMGLRYQITKGRSYPDGRHFIIIMLILENIGNITLENPYLVLASLENIPTSIVPARATRFKAINYKQNMGLHFFQSEDIIHPGMLMPAMELQIPIRWREDDQVVFELYGNGELCANECHLDLELIMGCSNLNKNLHVVSIPSDTFLDVSERLLDRDQLFDGMHLSDLS